MIGDCNRCAPFQFYANADSASCRFHLRAASRPPVSFIFFPGFNVIIRQTINRLDKCQGER